MTAEHQHDSYELEEQFSSDSLGLPQEVVDANSIVYSEFTDMKIKKPEIGSHTLLEKAIQLLNQYGDEGKDQIGVSFDGLRINTSYEVDTKNIYAPIIVDEKQYMFWLHAYSEDHATLQIHCQDYLDEDERFNIEKTNDGIITAFDFVNYKGETQHIDVMDFKKKTSIEKFEDLWVCAQSYTIEANSLDMHNKRVPKPGNVWHEIEKPFEEDVHQIMGFLEQMESYEKNK